MYTYRFSTYLSIAVLFGVLAMLLIFSSGDGGLSAVFAYVQAFVRASNVAIVEIILLSFFFGFFLVGAFLFYSSAMRGDSFRALLSRLSFRKIVQGVWNFIKAITPFLVCFALLCAIVGVASVLYRDKLVDERVVSWDRVLFGVFPFLLSGTSHLPAWLTAFIVWAYLYLIPVMFVAIVLFFWMNREVFYEFCAAFSWSSLFMVAGWLLIPVLTPQDRFLNNIYHLPISPQIALALQSFRPPEAVAHFLASLFSSSKEVSLISSFPSAHVVWAALVAYYVFRANRIAGLVTLPFFVAASFGTFFLAQHYAVDALAALPVAAVSIALTKKFRN